MSNRLAQEKSPYLLQHKDNPVDWYPWGEEAFALARERDCPIFLSIGYSTCYWCHVMEQDSFEHDDVAQALNQKFVCIKIDKEERPDVDAIYMDVVVGLTGHGGWPMTVFLTPELKPFWGGTFFWKKQLLAILPQITSAWENDRAAVMESGNKITQALSRSLDSVSQDADPDSFSILLNASQSRFDSVHGGFGAAPKFPPAEHLRSLLRVFARTQDAQALEIINKTLQAMARGGIYDQLGGGFHRYSTDAGWLIPHFEKMLYDNALLAITYFEAYQVTKEGFYKEIGCEILNYVQAQMTSAEGAFFSAQDAGEVGKEGEYYVWAHSELSSLLSPPELEEVEAVYSATKAGNFEGKYNIFCLSNSVAASRRNSELMNSARLKLLAQRGLRAAPHRDDKIITSWNGLMISAFALGARVTSNSSFLASAVSAASFLKKNLWDGKVLFRRYCDQQTAIPGFLEDYAYLIDGLLSLYEVSQNCEWFTWARELQLAQDFAFKHESSACYRFSTAQEIIAQKIDYLDNATPSANSVATLNNIRLFHFTAELSYYERAKTIIAEIYPHFLHYPTSSTKLLQAIDYLLGPTQELVFVASDISKIDEYLLAIRETFLPRTIFAFATPQSDSPPVAHGKQGISDTVTVYKCSNGVCEQPILSLSDFRSSLLT